MTTFKPGTRVVYTHTEGGSTAHNGRTGVTVGEVRDTYQPFVQVKWDDALSAPTHPFVHNLSPVASLVDSELRERLVELIVRNSSPDIYYTDVLTIARAFEDYIQGDTK